MSNALEMVMSVDRLAELHGFDYVGIDFFQNTSMKKHSNHDPGRYLLFL